MDLPLDTPHDVIRAVDLVERRGYSVAAGDARLWCPIHVANHRCSYNQRIWDQTEMSGGDPRASEGRELAAELLRWTARLHIALPQSLYDRARKLAGDRVLMPETEADMVMTVHGWERRP